MLFGSSIRHYSVKFLDSNSYSARFSKDPPPPYPTPYGRYRDSRKYTISSISADSVLRMVSSTTIPLRKPLHSFPKPYLSTWNLLSFVSFGMPYSVKSTENCCYSAQISKDPPPPYPTPVRKSSNPEILRNSYVWVMAVWRRLPKVNPEDFGEIC